jgi:hypothetical protein
MSNCPVAWHSERYSASLDLVDNGSLEQGTSTSTNEKRAVFLKPSKGIMSISATFKDIVVSDSFLGCRLSIRMGRLDCSSAAYNIKITSSASSYAGTAV